MAYTVKNLLQRAISQSIEFEYDWLKAMEGCNEEDDIEAKSEAKRYIKELKKYYKRRWKENPPV